MKSIHSAYSFYFKRIKTRFLVFYMNRNKQEICEFKKTGKMLKGSY